MTQTPETNLMLDTAIAWTVRVADPAFGDWEGFERWLAADPAHAAAYHEASAAMAGAGDLFEAPPSAPRRALPIDTVPAGAQRRRTHRWLMPIGGAIAASIAAIIGHQALQGGGAIVYETRPGHTQLVALADGSRVLLNGASRLEGRRDNPRTVELIRGQAVFTVVHDAAHPFRVTLGDAHIVDVGTRFDVVREGAATRIAVAEGAVDWQRGAAPVRLTAGQWLRFDEKTLVAARGSTAPDIVGDWSQGQLSFDDAPLEEAAADLSRTIGTQVTVASPIARRPVRGTIRLDGGIAVVVPRFAALNNVRATRTGSGWRLDGLP
jgi:transmembrane sensor